MGDHFILLVSTTAKKLKIFFLASMKILTSSFSQGMEGNQEAFLIYMNAIDLKPIQVKTQTIPSLSVNTPYANLAIIKRGFLCSQLLTIHFYMQSMWKGENNVESPTQ